MSRSDTTRQVVEHHLACFRAGDLEGMLSGYAPDAVMLTPDGPLRGVEAFRPIFSKLLVEFAAPGASFELKRQLVDGEYALILWSAESVKKRYELGADTFVVRQGQIVAQTFAAKTYGKP